MAQSIDEFARGTEHLEDRAHLAARLARGDRLRIKFGVDPTAPDIHLGHTVPMRRLRVWQDAGHLPVIIIGDWTARIGDPTGRSETRPPCRCAPTPRRARARQRAWRGHMHPIFEPWASAAQHYPAA